MGVTYERNQQGELTLVQLTDDTVGRFMRGNPTEQDEADAKAAFRAVKEALRPEEAIGQTQINALYAGVSITFSR